MEKRKKLAIVGCGALGQACGRAIAATDDLVLAGFVRRPQKGGEKLPKPFREVPTVEHISELGHVDAALVCTPTPTVREIVIGLLQHHIPAVECATLHGEDFVNHKREIDRMAAHFETPAIVGAGWDPGALSLLRNLFAVVIPKGYTETSWHPGISLHHSTVAGNIPGVKKALTAEFRRPGGAMQRYVYIEVEQEADFEQVANAIRNDPLYLTEQTEVFQVDSVEELENEGHGVLLERRGIAAGADRQHLLLEARYREVAMTAQIMVAAARALKRKGHRAYSLFDLPPRALWGMLAGHAEKEWI